MMKKTRVFELIPLATLDEFLIELESDLRVDFFHRLTDANKAFVIKQFKTDDLILFFKRF